MARKPKGNTTITSGSLTIAGVAPSIDRTWLPRTGIVIHFEGKTPTIQMKAQSTVIADVLRLSFEIGKIKMACDDKYSPMALGGLEKIAADALVAAADKLKYDGENDIADRLEWEREQDNYLVPMRNYVWFFFLRPHSLSLINIQVPTTPYQGSHGNQACCCAYRSNVF